MGRTTNCPTSTSTRSQRSSTPLRRTPGPRWYCPRSTQHVAIYSFVFYVLTYFASNFRQFNVHAKVFRWMMTVYPILTALTRFQVSNLVPYLAKVLPHFMGLYTVLLQATAFPRAYSLKRRHQAQQSKDTGHLQNATTQRQVGTPHVPRNGCLCTTVHTQLWRPNCTPIRHNWR
ncbi:hypothetical protein DSO57_1016356 [Entomophthora muscae]|uniref:Uncharacterized protein n=1 Tax=Entomophthora muscae TaxID=34485 RepID=A0ACC2UQY1_9FUNG|nr:hypothetical protein DSO57_1016356 [Entomophthora muscae]